jgi:hypothetical protein
MDPNLSRKWIHTLVVSPVGRIQVNLILIDGGHLDENRLHVQTRSDDWPSKNRLGMGSLAGKCIPERKQGP